MMKVHEKRDLQRRITESCESAYSFLVSLPEMRFVPLRKNNGHDHNMQEARTESPVHFFTSGAGGAGLYDLKPTYKKSVFKDRAFGFTVLEVDDAHADVIFVDADGEEVYRSHITQ